MSKAKKSPVRFEFDQSDARQRALSAEYPKDRRKILILRSVLVGVLLLTIVFGMFLPVGSVRKSGYGDVPASEHTMSFSAVDFLSGVIQMNLWGEDYKEEFIQNGGGDLLFEERSPNGHRAMATDDQIKRDVAYKRENTKGFGAYSRYVCFTGYFAVIDKYYSDARADAKSPEDYGFITEMEEATLESAMFLADHLPYELEHLNWEGANRFVQKVLAADSAGIYSAETAAQLAADHLIGEYDTEALGKSVIDARESLGFITSEAIPRIQDAFSGSGAPSAEFGIRSDSNLVIQMLMSLLCLAVLLIVLILTVVQGIKLYKQWKDPASNIKSSHSSILLLYVVVMVMVLSFVSGRYMEALLSAAGIIVSLFAVGTFVYEIVCDSFIKKFRKKYLTKE